MISHAHSLYYAEVYINCIILYLDGTLRVILALNVKEDITVQEIPCILCPLTGMVVYNTVN